MSIGTLSARGAERYTQEREIEAVRAALGGIDFDPCSSRAANRVVRARGYWTKPGHEPAPITREPLASLPDYGDGAAIDGLGAPWGSGRRTVWVNPPSTREGLILGGQRWHEPVIWWAKARGEYIAGRIKAFAFLFFNLEALRHCANAADKGLAGFPLDAADSVVWLYERPEFHDADGGPILGDNGKLSSPAHPALIVVCGPHDPSKLESIGWVSRR